MIQVGRLPIAPLAPERLSTPCDPAQLAGVQAAASPSPFGQARALEALQLGLDTPGRGYNVFVLGRPGSGRHALARALLDRYAASRPAPQDCCYLYNFAQPQQPRVLMLPPGEGRRLRDAMQQFVIELRKAIEAAFESDEYRSRVEAIQKQYKEREGHGLQSLGEQAMAQGVALVQAPQGFTLLPVRKGQPMSPQEFQKLPQAERDRLEAAIKTLGEQLTQLMHELPRLRRELQTRIRDASRDAMALAAGHLLDELKESFAAHPQAVAFLDEVLKDVVEAGEQLRQQQDEDDEEADSISGSISLVRYQVNLLVGHEAAEHAPVVHCDNPTYPNLVGRVDHVAHLGTMLTNFTMVKPGALHRANGGYLLLDALQVLAHPYAWDGLKRALRSGEVRVEGLPEAMGLGSTVLLEPEPVALSLKVVMVGERHHYYLLQQLDADFDGLFRVAADFEDDVPRDASTTREFAVFVTTLSRQLGLRPCEPAALARLVEHAARMAEDAGRLSTHAQSVEEILHEADTQAARDGRTAISREDVREALAARERRADRLRGRLRDAMLKETLLVATRGAQAGQVNGLAVAQLGDFAFGHPVRITATARGGDEHVVDIERESALGQPLHSKGVMILSAFLGARYGRVSPLAFAASLVFEQSYGPVEGDSASLAELCALLSALADAPLRQSLAATGSIDQFGRVQAVGGVNEKIEGFFDVCRARGLTGDEGVLIPAANVPHLMLHEDVVRAAREGRFHIYPVSDVDEALALLSGLPAGAADAGGRYPPASFNGQVSARLAQLSSARGSTARALRVIPLPGGAAIAPRPARRSRSRSSR
jgi:predicted ATP-dependent protease